MNDNSNSPSNLKLHSEGYKEGTREAARQGKESVFLVTGTTGDKAQKHRNVLQSHMQHTCRYVANALLA